MSNETWDYIAEAASAFAASDDGANEPYYEGICYLLAREASEAAIEFARLTKEGVPEEHARMAVQLTVGHGAAISVARAVLGVDHTEWRQSGGVTSTDPNPWQ
jgi:hypothetical protein